MFGITQTSKTKRIAKMMGVWGVECKSKLHLSKLSNVLLGFMIPVAEESTIDDANQLLGLIFIRRLRQDLPGGASYR